MADEKEPTGSDDSKASEAGSSSVQSDKDATKVDAKSDAAAKDEPASEVKAKGDAKSDEDAKVVAKAKAAKPTDDEADDDGDDADDDEDDKPKAKAKDDDKAKATEAKAKDDKKPEPKKPAKPINPRAKWTLFLIVSVASLVSDQGTKIWARHSLATHRNDSRDPEYTKELQARGNTDCEIPDDLKLRDVPVKLRRGEKDKVWQPCSGTAKPVIDGYWDWELSMNPGSAFGLFSSQGFARVLLSLVGIGAVFGMLWMLRKSRADQKILHWALALVAGGAVGNLIDRIMDGVVTDFILWRYQEHRWPVFNVADIVLVVGVGLMFIDIQKEGKRDKLKKKRRAERAKAAGLVRKFDD